MGMIGRLAATTALGIVLLAGAAYAVWNRGRRVDAA